MLPSLLVAVTLTAPGAPVPKDVVPNTTGPAPRIVAAKADASGSVWITAQVYQKQKATQQFFTVENGKQVMKQQEIEQIVPNYIRKTIGDFGGKFGTVDGTPLNAEEATRRVKDGATLLVTSDGKPVDAGWLKAVAGDTIIMTAEGLGEAHFVCGYAPYPSTASPRLAMLGTNDKGEVRVPVNPNMRNSNGVVYDDFGRGRAIRGRMVIQGNVAFETDGSVAPSTTPTPPDADGKKALADIKFDAYDVTGKLIPRREALTRLKAGGLTLVAGDNRFPDADYLKAFREDLIVIVTPELVFQPGQQNPFDCVPSKPAAPAAGQPANAAPVQAVPAVGIAAPAVIKRVQVRQAE